MQQVLFHLPYFQIPVYGFGTMLFVGFVVGELVAAWRAKKSGLDPEIIHDIAIWVLVGGLVGARLFYVCTYWNSEVKTFWDIFRVWRGGLTLYGSFLGAMIGFFAVWRIRRFPLLPTLDALAPAMAIGYAFGRLGCFLNGCCHGDVCHLPWAVRFPAGSAPWWDQLRQGVITQDTTRTLPVHPTQIYSTINGFLIFLLLTAFYPVRKRDGQVAALLLITYPVTRFFIEILRDDDVAWLAGMTLSQLISIGVLVCGLSLWAYLRTEPAGLYAEETAANEPLGAGRPAGNGPALHRAAPNAGSRH